MKNIYAIFFFVLILSVSCTKDFEEINTNPNSPDQVTNAGLLLPHVIRSSVNSHFYHSFTRGSVAANLVASDFASNFSNWARSDAPTYFYWDYYNYIRDLNEVISMSEARNQPNYKGVALVLRSWMFQCLTDVYGPIPFREAANAKLTGISTPKYDEQDVVYAGLLADLEEANNLIGSSNEPISGDILYGGDLLSWKKFANGLRLRILMRQSHKVDPKAAMTEMVDNAGKYPLFTSYRDQAALQYLGDQNANESPFYRSANSSSDTKLSKQLVNYLKSMNDSRLYAYALPTPASSAQDGNGNRPDPKDFIYEGDLNGTGSFVNNNFSSPVGMLWMSIQYAPELASSTAAQALIMTYSEVQFILAEAAEKGYIAGGSVAAETYYRKGIEDQFKYYSSRIPASYATSYLKLNSESISADASYFNQESVAYTGTASQRLEKIALQKWISLYLVGFEAWSEWKRTGFPNIPVGPVGPGYVPRRMIYPSDELRINEVNYKQAVQWLGADDMQSRTWWDK
jgi:hypothetical protein